MKSKCYLLRSLACGGALAMALTGPGLASDHTWNGGGGSWADSNWTPVPATNPLGWLETYNVVWETPSLDSLDSMPLSGRSGAGANVWVQDGSLWLYLGHSGAYDEQRRPLKLGCVKITPVGFTLGGAGYRQELSLADGSIRIRQGDFQASLWFANETLVIESSSDTPAALDVAFGTWRDQYRSGITCDFDFPGSNGGTDNFNADTVQPGMDGFTWFHRNADYPFDVAAIAAAQGIPGDKVHDVTTLRSFGGAVAVGGGITEPVAAPVRWQFWDGKAWTGRSTEQTSHVITIRLGAKMDADPQAWRSEATAMLAPAARTAAKADETARWLAFWNRSHMIINPEANHDDPGWLIGRNYQLFRYMLACNRDGEIPLLFNGGIFTTDHKPGRITGNNGGFTLDAKEPLTPDFRRWMKNWFTSQNQRWLGWATVATGDADMLTPTTRFYRDRSAIAAQRAQNLGADGAVFVEVLDLWGHSGVSPSPEGICTFPWMNHHFSMGLENAWLNLQAHSSMGIPLDADLGWMAGTVFFYDSFYRAQNQQRAGQQLDGDGKLVLYPGNGLEFAFNATDGLDSVSALHRVTEGLLALTNLPAATRTRLEAIRTTLPPLPIGMRDGVRSLQVAKMWEAEGNQWEPVESYAFWPYRMVGVTQPGTLQLARDTWDSIPASRSDSKQDYSWMPTVISTAAMAWPAEAKQRAIFKMANNAAPQARFPAFFGPGHDWLPDHNWGCSGMVGIQEMLLAPEPGANGKLHLFPSWPAEWDVDFKLHAPGQTLIQARMRGGKLVKLHVSPQSRAADIVDWLGKQPPFQRSAPPISLGKPLTASSQYGAAGYDAARANDGDSRTRWASDDNARSGWLNVDLGTEMSVSRAWLSEVEYPLVREFTIEVQQGGTWVEVARGTTIGPDRTVEFTPVNARNIRLNVLRADGPLNINEFQVY